LIKLDTSFTFLSVIYLSFASTVSFLLSSSSFSLTTPRTLISTPFPYTTLFRSRQSRRQPVRDPDRRGRELRRGQRRLMGGIEVRSEEHTSELQSRFDIVCRLLLEKKKKKAQSTDNIRERLLLLILISSFYLTHT